MKKAKLDEYFSIRYCFAGEEAKISPALDSYAENSMDLSDVNRVLEFNSIKEFFDKYSHVNGWSDEKYQKYKTISLNADTEVREFFQKITEETLVQIYNSCEVMFWDDFWTFFYRYKVYEKISESRFKDIISGLHMSPNSLTENKYFVNRFDSQIAEMLRNPEFGARFIIDYYFGKINKEKRYYLPESLTKEDKYNIVKAYINGDVVNANVLDLIINGQSRSPKEFDVDVKLRHLAKKRNERFWQENTMPMINHETGVSVSFSPENPDQELCFVDGTIIAKYNSNWIKNNLDYPTLLNNFIYLFFYTDGRMRCSLTAGNLKQGIIERLFTTQGNGMYPRGQAFELLNALANSQMHCYVDILKGYDIYLEEVIKWFFEEYLKDEFEITGFTCIMPYRTDSILSKYERLVTVMDGITKQFKLYCEEGEIDRELYEMTSGSVKYNSIPSLIKNKYAYINDQRIEREIHDMFSDQSLLSYTERTKDKHATLYELLINERVELEEIENCNRIELDWLVERGAVVIVDGTLTLNYERVLILKELYENNVICLQYKHSEILRKLIIDGEIKVGSTLLCKPEWEYFNYVLNKAEFSNGLDLRNRYIHDTNSLDENRQRYDYTILLKMFIILVIKINEEFCLRESLMRTGTDFYEL